MALSNEKDAREFIINDAYKKLQNGVIRVTCTYFESIYNSTRRTYDDCFHVFSLVELVEEWNQRRRFPDPSSLVQLVEKWNQWSGLNEFDIDSTCNDNVHGHMQFSMWLCSCKMTSSTEVCLGFYPASKETYEKTKQEGIRRSLMTEGPHRTMTLLKDIPDYSWNRIPARTGMVFLIQRNKYFVHDERNMIIVAGNDCLVLLGFIEPTQRLV
jgi:hypothetical protein